MFVFFTEYY